MLSQKYWSYINFGPQSYGFFKSDIFKDYHNLLLKELPYSKKVGEDMIINLNKYSKGGR